MKKKNQQNLTQTFQFFFPSYSDRLRKNSTDKMNPRKNKISIGLLQSPSPPNLFFLSMSISCILFRVHTKFLADHEKRDHKR